jgi:UDP-glucose 4-epimerase
MILITGGLGFIGSHVTRAILDLDESCLLIQRRTPTAHKAFAEEAGKRVFVEQADITDLETLLEIGAHHKITGIIHLAASVPHDAPEPVEGARHALDGLLNVVHAARAWDVPRVGVASTIGVYGGIDVTSPVGEDTPLPMTAGHAIPAFKKIGELLTNHLADVTGIEIFSFRISAAWGPLGRAASMFFPAPQLVHAAARDVTPDLSGLRVPAFDDEGGDLCYVKDCGRAIAMLQLAGKLNHRTYNVASGRVTTNRELIAAIKKVIPAVRIELPDGRNPHGPADDLYLDTTRLRQDTGYQPAYDTEQAVADYIHWLQAGNER